MSRADYPARLIIVTSSGLKVTQDLTDDEAEQMVALATSFVGASRESAHVEAVAMALAVLESPTRSRCWVCVPEDWEEHDADEKPTRGWFREQARVALAAATAARPVGGES